MLSTNCTVAGALLLLHAAYSCSHYKNMLLELDMDIDVDGSRRVPPPDVIIECGLGLLVLMFSQLFLGPGAGTWQPCISGGTTKRRPLAAAAFCTRDFDIYADRSKAVLAKKSS